MPSGFFRARRAAELLYGIIFPRLIMAGCVLEVADAVLLACPLDGTVLDCTWVKHSLSQYGTGR